MLRQGLGHRCGLIEVQLRVRVIIVIVLGLNAGLVVVIKRSFLRNPLSDQKGIVRSWRESSHKQP